MSASKPEPRVRTQHRFSKVHFVQVNYLPQNTQQYIYHQYMNSATTINSI